MLHKARYNEPLPATAIDESERDHDEPAGDGPEEPDSSTSQPAPHGLDANSRSFASIPPDLRRVLSLADPAVLLLDEAGFFVFANEAANSLLDYGGDEILGVHFTQICIHDAAWLEGEFGRLKQNGIWSGHVVLRSRQGRQVNVGVNAGTLVRSSEPPSSYLALIHPVGEQVQASSAPLEDLPHGLAAGEVRTLQLLMDGFGKADIATIQAQSEAAISRTIDEILLKVQAPSVVAACLVALKEHLLG